MPGPSISLLMPCYNAHAHIETAVRAAMAALEETDELVIQDGASSDGTLDIINRLTSRDSRVRLVSERDDGQADALNKALARARGAYVGWLNADDIIDPEGVRAVRERIAQSSPAVVTADHAVL